MSNCKASGPALIPGTVDTYVCLQNGPGIRQAIKRTTLDANGVRTLVYLEEDGTTAIVNAVETACPPLVLVANPQVDIRVTALPTVGTIEDFAIRLFIGIRRDGICHGDRVCETQTQDGAPALGGDAN
ncbi:hypothetical protein J2W27_000352 [Variovorax boronicumulans]|uniref:hypothetical protein n=1 Tax=Variovorax boronicumulans TaxID=436515 RepID=UPI00278B6FF3|nr:hypothetical protein [Variovorax boronicumulans]MDP9908259.1 hypothetical protein [Variovorax boronicumulans]